MSAGARGEKVHSGLPHRFIQPIDHDGETLLCLTGFTSQVGADHFLQLGFVFGVWCRLAEQNGQAARRVTRRMPRRNSFQTVR